MSVFYSMFINIPAADAQRAKSTGEEYHKGRRNGELSIYLNIQWDF